MPSAFLEFTHFVIREVKKQMQESLHVIFHALRALSTT